MQQQAFQHYQGAYQEILNLNASQLVQQHLQSNVAYSRESTPRKPGSGDPAQTTSEHQGTSSVLKQLHLQSACFHILSPFALGLTCVKMSHLLQFAMYRNPL